MKMGSGVGIKSSNFFSNELLDSRDMAFMSEKDYQNYTDILSLNISNLVSDTGLDTGVDFVSGGLTMSIKNPASNRQVNLMAGAAVSFSGSYLSNGTWGFVAESGANFSVVVPDTQILTFDDNSAYGSDRIDVVQIRPVRNEYNYVARQFRDPITGIISSSMINTRHNYSFEVMILKGTPGSGAPIHTAGWIKIGEVIMRANASSLVYTDILDTRYEYLNPSITVCWNNEQGITMNPKVDVWCRPDSLVLRGSAGDIAVNQVTGAYSAVNRNYLYAWLASYYQEYDLVIDSNAKLDLWCQHTGGLYKRVLIKAGTWTASALGLTAGVLINLTAAGTKYVFAEKGASIQYSGAYAGGIMYGMYRASQLTDFTQESYEGVNLSITNTSSVGGSNSFAFYNLNNLTKCSGTATGQNVSGQWSAGFNSCNVLIACIGSGYGNYYTAGFTSCNDLVDCKGYATPAGSTSGTGFNLCTRLANCYATSNGAGTCYGFSNCSYLENCTGSVTGTVFQASTFMSNCIGLGAGAPGYDLVVDSNAALDLLINNNSGAYVRVLVKTGTWTASVSPPANNTFIDTARCGLREIVGEVGSTIVMNSNVAATVYGIKDATKLCRARGLSIAMINSNSGNASFALYGLGFVRDCTFTHTDSTHSFRAVDTCDVVDGCSVIYNNGLGIGFNANSKVTNCDVTFTGSSGGGQAFVDNVVVNDCSVYSTASALLSLNCFYNGVSGIITNCRVILSGTLTLSGAFNGFYGHNLASNCRLTIVSITCTTLTGFSGGNFSNCYFYVSTTANCNGNLIGFTGSRMNNCTVSVAAGNGAGTYTGFSGGVYMVACISVGMPNAGAGAGYGISTCTYVGHCASSGSKTANYNASFADAGSNACANTSAGGYNS